MTGGFIADTSVAIGRLGASPSEGREAAARHSAIVGVTEVSSQRDNIMVCGYFVPTRDASRARVVRRAMTVFPRLESHYSQCLRSCRVGRKLLKTGAGVADCHDLCVGTNGLP